MSGGTNGPATLNGAAFSYPAMTLATLRTQVVARLGFAAMAANPPPGLLTLADSFIDDANEQLYERYPVLREKKWWNITVNNAGGRFYDVPYEGAYTGLLIDLAFVDSTPDTITRSAGSFVTDGFTTGMEVRVHGSTLNDAVITLTNVAATTLTTSDALTAESAGAPIVLSEVGFRRMDFRHHLEAWVNDGSTWSMMTHGINPAQFNQTNASIPLWYDLREYVEIWPIPDKEYELYFLAYSALTPIIETTDTPAVDSRCVFLMALANAKAHYGQQDAGTYYRQLEVRIGRFVAGTHGGRRYIPDGSDPKYGPMPYPAVTFSR